MPDKQTVYVAMYEHKNGTDVRVFTTHNAACQWKADIGDQFWDQEFPEEEVRPGPEDIGEAYFDLMGAYMGEEWFSIHEALLEEGR